MIDSASIKTIVVDLDRTLLRTDGTISPYTISVLAECKKRVIKIVVATARPLRTAKQFSDLIGADAMVVSNGARLISGDFQISNCICNASAKRLLSVLNLYSDTRITLETGDCAYSNHPIGEYETVVTNNLVDVVDREGALKILVHLDREDTLALVKEQLSEDLYYSIAHRNLMQIMSTSATKWNGIMEVFRILNCLPNETVYFGDDYDDIEPIKMCGIGVAVSNGICEVKTVADFVAECNDADGVAGFIEQMILNNSN